MKTTTLLILGGLVLASTLPATAQMFYGPTAYVKAADSPFASPAGFSYFHLEDFKDATFTPGWSANAGWVPVNGTSTTDSVDADDGVVDGSGVNGGSFYSGNTNTTLTITFNAATLGTLPTHVGIVWTDVGNVTSGSTGFGGVMIRAWNAANVSLGALNGGVLGNGSPVSSTAEDRFLGISYAGGISRFEITMANSLDWEVDHLQYGAFGAAAGATVPEPHTTTLAAAGALALMVVIGRHHRRIVHT